MNKVLIIGIDGLDRILLSKFRNSLPNFSKLEQATPLINLSSVFPPDTMPAWISIYTGLNPAKHGVINFMDPSSKEKKVIFSDVDNSTFRGRTIWDIAGELGKKVCIVLPYAVYPPYPVNGTMICRTLKVVHEDFPVQTYPESVFEKFDLSSFNLNLFHGFPSKINFNKFVDSCKKRTLDEKKLGLQLLKNRDWDLYFIYLSALDAIQHTFWKYFDEKHPDYPGDNPYKTVIRDFYVLFDQLVGEFLSSIDSNVTVVVVSDHGQGMRPVELYNMNKFLKEKGLLVQKNEKIKDSIKLQVTLLFRSLLAKFIEKFGVGNFAVNFLHRFPSMKRIAFQTFSVDWDKTIAWASDLSGIKSYPYGGIILRKDLPASEYEQLRRMLIDSIGEIENPKNSKKLVGLVCRREELYQGKYIERYPDIVMELVDSYGIGWSIKGSTFEKGKFYKIQSGSHKRHSAVCLISNLDNKQLLKKNVTLMDFAPTILELLGIDAPLSFDGTSILGSSVNNVHLETIKNV